MSVIAQCESCPKPIREGEPHYYTADDVWLCEEHAPMLSDAIRQHDEMFEEGPAEFYHPAYESFEEMASERQRLKLEYQERGDRSLAHK